MADDADGIDPVIAEALKSLDIDFIGETFDPDDEGCNGDAVFDLFINDSGVIEAVYNADESSACGREEVLVPGVELQHNIRLDDPVLVTLRKNLAAERQNLATTPSL